VKTVASPSVVLELTERLGRLRIDSRRRWGTLTPHEMLCHLGDATDMVLRIRPRPAPIPVRRKTLVKLLAIWAPLPWPRGFPTNPFVNPKVGGTRPSDFERDRARVLAGIEGIAAASQDTLEQMHGNFGTMSVRDWQRWAYRHTNHHLRQFGV
jgi:hypothetical protein